MYERLSLRYATEVYELERPRDSENVVSRIVLTQLAGRWSAAILQQLQFGERRYSQLRWAISNVSEKMLAQTLRELERNGLVSRTSFPVLPPRVVYTLTDLGQACSDRITALVELLDGNAGIIEHARTIYAHRRSH